MQEQRAIPDYTLLRSNSGASSPAAARATATLLAKCPSANALWSVPLLAAISQHGLRLGQSPERMYARSARAATCNETNCKQLPTELGSPASNSDLKQGSAR